MHYNEDRSQKVGESMEKLLLLEDDKGLIDGLKYALNKNGFALHVVMSVEEAKAYVEQHHDIALLLLDVSLPDGTGFDVCEYIREKGNTVPIIFLTAADEEVNVIRGLDSGGDDYITKPFKLGELCSRIKALIRRSSMVPRCVKEKSDETLQLTGGEVRVDLLGCRTFYKGQQVEVTAAEYRLLCILLKNKNRVVTRQMIFDAMWDGQGNFVDDNTLSVYIRRLREKIEEDPSHPKYLKTARGFGYMWEEAADENTKR